MTRQMKVNACLTLLVAVAFYLFFQLTKHHPVLSPVNAFADDPYDSVGSAGTQLALFTAILSLVRAFRPYQPKQDRANQQVLLLRGEYITCLSVAVTLLVDGVALLRYPALWIGFPAGRILLALLGGMAVLTVLVGWLLFRSAQANRLSRGPGKWRRAITFSLVGIVIFAVYPVNWRHSVPGELLTVFVGTTLFFVLVWAWEMALAPTLGPYFEDVMDDLTSVYDWLKAHTGHLVVVLTLWEKLLGLPLLRPLLKWLNPRRHPWNAALLIGMLIGAVLALAEMTGGEGGPPALGQFAFIMGIFMGIEGGGVLLGYALLRKPLGLVRHASQEKCGTRSHKPALSRK